MAKQFSHPVVALRNPLCALRKEVKTYWKNDYANHASNRLAPAGWPIFAGFRPEIQIAFCTAAGGRAIAVTRLEPGDCKGSRKEG